MLKALSESPIGGIERAIQIATKYGYPLISSLSPTSISGGFINPEPEIRIYPRPRPLLEKLLGAETFDEAVLVTKQEISNMSKTFVKALFREEIRDLVLNELGIDATGGGSRDGIKLEMDLQFSFA